MQEHQMRNRQHEAVLEQNAAGYGSDGSETLSANSAQSMQKRNQNREEQQRAVDPTYDQPEVQSYSPRHHFYENHTNYSQNQRGTNGRTVRMDVRTLNNVDENGEGINGIDESRRVNGGSAAAQNQLAMKERKKSLMTRLIPGRNAPNGKKMKNVAKKVTQKYDFFSNRKKEFFLKQIFFNLVIECQDKKARAFLRFEKVF